MVNTFKKLFEQTKDLFKTAGLGVLGTVGVIIGIVLIFGLAFGILSFCVWIATLLWNGVLHDVFPVVPEISFWQMWGLYLLSNILFKSSGSSNNSKDE